MGTYVGKVSLPPAPAVGGAAGAGAEVAAPAGVLTGAVTFVAPLVALLAGAFVASPHAASSGITPTSVIAPAVWRRNLRLGTTTAARPRPGVSPPSMRRHLPLPQNVRRP